MKSLAFAALLAFAPVCARSQDLSGAAGADASQKIDSLKKLWAARRAAAPAAEDPATPEPRTTEYPWMSVAGWNKRHEELKALSKQGGVDVLFLGDSITERWAASATWRLRYAPLKAADYGIGGDTTQNVLWRVEDGELDGLDPKVVVLLIGTNNLGLRGDGAWDVARGVTVLVGKLRKRLPKAKIILIGVLPRGEKPTDPFRAEIRSANARIAALDDGKRVRFLDFGDPLLEVGGALSKDVAPDSLHVSERGYEIWADAMDPLLRKMLNESL